MANIVIKFKFKTFFGINLKKHKALIHDFKTIQRDNMIGAMYFSVKMIWIINIKIISLHL